MLSKIATSGAPAPREKEKAEQPEDASAGRLEEGLAGGLELARRRQP